MILHFQYISNLCKSVVKQRLDQKLQYNDMLNSLIEVSKEHPEMTEEIMYKTCIQFFSDGYESAGMVRIIIIIIIICISKGSLQKKKKKSVTFFTLGGGQDRSSLHFSKTCLECVSIHSELFKMHLLLG